MFTAEELRRMMPSQEEYIQSPLNKEAIELIMYSASSAAKRGFHGISFVLVKDWETKGHVSNNVGLYYEASQVVQFLQDTALGYKLWVENNEHDYWVSLHWGDNHEITEDCGVIEVTPNSMTTQMLMDKYETVCLNFLSLLCFWE